MASPILYQEGYPGHFNQRQNYINFDFEALVNILKKKQSLPEHYFVNNIPFFELNFIPKEAEIKELFQDQTSQEKFLDSFASHILSLSPNKEEHSIGSYTMSFAQICFYKILPCPDLNCRCRPREIVTHNQYKDYEFGCPFYHHNRDRRRNVISLTMDGEFEYKANYFEEGKTETNKEKYSQNYYESMFHPLYYKMFKCKRQYCSSHNFCPFYHDEQEKRTWDKRFFDFVIKDRITYVKDKQKYFETSGHLTPNKDDSFSSNHSPGGNNHNNHQGCKSPQHIFSPNQQTPQKRKTENNGQSLKSKKKKFHNVGNSRKGSGSSLDSYTGNTSDTFLINPSQTFYNRC